MLLDYAPQDLAEDTVTAVDGSRYFRTPSPGRIVRRSQTGLALVMLSEDPARDAASSARAVLANDASADLVAAATRLAAAGYTIRRAEAERHADASPAFEPPISQREREVLELLAEGASNKVIARRLDISVHTAKFHVASVCTKLKARNRTDAVSIALREGMLGA